MDAATVSVTAVYASREAAGADHVMAASLATEAAIDPGVAT